MVTNAPLFAAKCALLPGARFVVGADTAVRLVMPRYYEGGTAAAMVEALLGLARAGSKVLVAGRLIPAGKPGGPPADGSGGAERFVTLKDVALPPALAAVGLFEEVPEGAFRVDLSSTELRARLAAQKGKGQAGL